MRICQRCDARFAWTPADNLFWSCPACGHATMQLDGFTAFAPSLAHENDGFAESHFDGLAPLEARSFWFRSRNTLIVWALRRYFPGAETFLEIGCGTGFVLRGIRKSLPHLIVAGSEIFARGLDVARERLPSVPLFQMDARDIPFEQAFDVIGAFDVLEHIAADEDVLSQVHRAIRPGGGILLTVPQHPRLWNVIDEYSQHKRRYTRAELVSKVERSGFTVLIATSFMSLLLPLLLLSRLRKPKSIDQYDPSRELRLHPAVNAVLEQVMTVERQVIRSGVSMPVGGSLLLVAKRAR